MILALVAMIGMSQFQSAPTNEAMLAAAFQPFGGIVNEHTNYYSGSRIMMSPLSGSVLVARALRAGRIRVPYAFQSRPYPFALTCSPVPCTTPNVRASGGGSPVNETPIAVEIRIPACRERLSRSSVDAENSSKSRSPR